MLTKVASKGNGAYIFHTDPGHGWLAVKRSELASLGILNKITAFSYQKGGTVYLEEDCDLASFCEAKKAIGVTAIRVFDSYRDHSPIRNYNDFVA